MPTDPPKADPPQRKRRWFQFSLRTLLIVVTLAAVPCSYVGWRAKIERERNAAVKRVYDLGGVVTGFENEIFLPVNTSINDRRMIAAALPEKRIRAFIPPGRRLIDAPDPQFDDAQAK